MLVMDNYYNYTLLGNDSEGGFGRAAGGGDGGSRSFLTVVVAAGLLISLSIVGTWPLQLWPVWGTYLVINKIHGFPVCETS